jgi:hypothetical protein
MKTLSLLTIALCCALFSFAQDFIYEGPARAEVRSFWTNAMGIPRSGKIAEGIAMMEAKLAVTKQKDPAYKTADMEAELAKWKSKLNAAPKTSDKNESSSKPGPAAPQRMVNIADLTTLAPDNNYSGQGKMYVNIYFKQAADAKTAISESNFNTAQNKTEQMEKVISQLKTKDPLYNTAAMEKELSDFKAALETQKYNDATAHQAGRNAAQNAGKADELLRQLFESTHIGFSTGDEPVMPIRVQEYKDKTQTYLALGAKGNANQLDFMKKLIDKHIIETNREIVMTDNLVAKGSGTNWAEIAYYIIQYHLAFWDAAQKVYPDETDFANEYKKTADFATQIGSIANMKAKGGAAELVEIKNRKLPVPVVKDAKLEKILTDGFNAKYGASNKVSALKAVLTQDGWTTLRNAISGAVIGRERTAKLAYKGSDGKCYVLTDYVFIHEEYIGSSFINTKAVFNWLDGKEMLCENVK